MANKTVNIILLVAGILAFVLAIVLGIIGYPHAGFGYYKIGLAVVGVLVAVTGAYFLIRKKTPKA